MKTGFLLSLDAIAAITLLLTVSLFLAGMSFTYSSPELRYQRYYYSGKDMATVLEETKMGALSDVVNLSAYGLGQEDMDRTVLDVIGSFWAEGNKSKAENLTKEIFGKALSNTGLNYEVSFNGESIYSSQPGYSDYLARLSTIVSGYEKTRPVNGYMAKVYATKVSKTNSEFVYFGGYEGDGNITKAITLPSDANVTGVYMEMNAGNNFTLYVNGNFSGQYIKTAANFSADNWTVCSPSSPLYCSYFGAGGNAIQLNFTTNGSNYIGGGYLKVTYKTSELTGGEYSYSGETATGDYFFPGIKGIINLYSSFYVPGTLQNISAHLHYRNNLTFNNQGIPVYFAIGPHEIYRSNQTGELVIDIPEKNISDAFGGKANLTRALSNFTVPLRFGTDTFAFTSGEGTSDSILITDISGSMGDSCDVNTTSCQHTDCNPASGCQNYRIDVAKDVDKEFVSEILNYSGNKLGLVSYNTTLGKTHRLSNDSSSLNAEINSYISGGWTCVSCGINNATGMLDNAKIIKTLIASKSSWFYNTSYPSGEPPAINGSVWTLQNYTDYGWNNGQAILGFENSPYSPGVDTNISNNGGNYYFRKHFNVSNTDSIEEAEIYVLSDDDAEIYLNGHLINNDTQRHNATYWNRGKVVFQEDFETYYASGANRLYTTQINSSPGYWIINGTPTADKDVYLMANYAGYPAQNGTDVLVFRDMDAYGYAETYLNFSNSPNLMLSYWWRMGPEAIESGEYANVNIWDGSWHVLKTYNYSYVTRYYLYDHYLREEIDLSEYNMINNFTLRFGSRSSNTDERFYVDNIKIREKIAVNKSYFMNGENVIAVKLRNSDALAAKFDMELNVTTKRYKAMLVMSDGFANRCIPGTDCGEEYAKNQSIGKACEARDKYGINVYSVGFGSGADTTTLRRIACWNCTANNWVLGCNRFYNSSNAEELKQIYKDIAEDIANASYAAQAFNYTGNVSLDNALYMDAYITFNYTPVYRSTEYGEILMSFESPRLRDSTGEAMITDNETGTKQGWFIIPGDTEIATQILDSKITSYSSYYWTDRLWVNSSNTPSQNWTMVYWLANYSSDYEKLGDPYVIQIPSNLLKANGNNSFKIGTGTHPSPLSDGRGASPDDRVIYTLGVRGIGLSQYSDVFPKARGSKPTIYYDSNGDNIPESSKMVEVGPDPNDVFDPENDSIDNAFMKLIDTMNFINDLNAGVADLNHTASGPSGTGDGSSSNPIDLEITEDVNFKADFISQIPSMWGPAIMDVKIWG